MPIDGSPNARGSITLAGLGLVSAGTILIWSAINDPVGGPIRVVGTLLKGELPKPGDISADNGGGFGLGLGVGAAGVNAASGGAIDSRHAGLGASVRAKIVSVATQYIGTPYVTGGASHRAMDCSGLVMVAYRDGAGISLPHKATLQAARGVRISESALQAGDLVAWGVPGNYPHIAIALNPSTVISAWTYGVPLGYGPVHQKAVPGFGYPDCYRLL